MPEKPNNQPTTPVADAISLENFVTYKLDILSKMWSRQGERYLKKNHGIAIPDYRILAILATHGEMSVREIANHSKMDKALISRVVNRLVTAKKVNSKPDPSDGRLVLLSLTTEGLHLFQAILPHAQERQKKLLMALEPEEKAAFIKMLDKLITDSQKAG